MMDSGTLRLAKGTLWTLRALFGLVLAILAFGAWGGFPVLDDAYLVLFLREAGPVALAAEHSHRPLFGLLLKWAGSAFGTHPAPYVAMATAFWALMAWQTYRLSLRLLPAEPRVAPLAALMVLAPVVVSTQYTTATTVLSVNLPVSLCLAALLLALPSGAGRERRPLLVAALLVVVAVMLSEYGLAAAAAAVVILATRRRILAAGALLGAAAAGYGTFRILANVSVRSRQVPSAQLEALSRHPLEALFRFPEGLWHSVIGAWGTAAGAIRLDMESRSTIFALLVGLVVATLMIRVARRCPAGSPEGSDRERGGLLLAVAAGILPVVLANRSLVSDDPYESRYLLPVLPFAAMATAWGASRIAAVRFREAVCFVLAFVSGYGVVVGAFGARRQQSRMEELGALLRPLVQATDGITVAVVPDEWMLDGNDMTPKVTLRWSDADARRAWVMPAGQATLAFGSRRACGTVERVDLARELMSTPRNGPLSNLVWLTLRRDSVGELEPYCLDPAR